MAKQGQEREWHFAHVSGGDCAQGAESALHKAAKQILVDAGGVMLPSQVLEVEVVQHGSRIVRGSAGRPAHWADFIDAQQERLIRDVQPDVLAIVGSGVLAIEVAVTHFVDESKAARLRSLQLPAIEIDLSAYETPVWDWEALRLAVVDGIENKRWIHQLDQRVLEAEAREAAVVPAQSPRQKKPEAAKPPRTRYYVNGRIVDLIELPYGIALWCPYDPDLNVLIKRLVNRHGGRWQRHFKNWLVPLAAKSALEAELVAMSASDGHEVRDCGKASGSSLA